MNSYREHANQDARLVMLRELSKETDYRLNDTILAGVLDAFGHRQSRGWLRGQLLELETLGAVKITEAGSVMIAQITRRGMEHVENRVVIDGIARPSPEA